MARKKDYTEEFLNEFKKVEQLLQQVYGSNITFRDVEQMMEEKGNSATSKKMQLCRNIRNYASHNPDINTFMPIPEEACDYMRKLYAEFERQITTAKDSMSRAKALSAGDNLIYGAQRLAKLPAVPVIDKLGVLEGAFDNDVLRKCVADGVSLKTTFGKFEKENIKLSTIPNYACVMQSTPMEEVNDIFNEYKMNVVYVTSDGKSKGKYIGMVVKTID